MLNAMLVATGPLKCTLGSVRIALLTAFLTLGVASCTTPERRDASGPSITAEPPSKGDAWKGIATPADRDRLAKLGLAWQEALGEAQPSFQREIDSEGALLRPRAALARPALTPGSYNCRLIKLGKVTTKAVAFERFKPFFCYVEVEGELLTIVKQTGSQRPAGRLWEDDRPDRLVYLGSLALGDEQQPMAYNEDAKRDMAGVVERIGPFKWRLVIPWPQGTSKLDVFELKPVAQQPGE
jgi:hypothetical protein